MPQKYKILIIPTVSFLVILGLFLFLIQFVYGRIVSLNQQVTDSKTLQAQLSSKIAQLTQLDQETLDLTDNAYTALPDTNPAALAIFQLRKIASENQITLNNIAINRAQIEGEEISRSLIDFDAEGEYERMISMFEALRKSAPIMNIENFKINRASGAIVEANVAMNTFWAPFPENITTFTEPLVSLSDEQLSILEEIGTYSLPSFASGEPSDETARPNPFSIDN